jgi:type II secretory pathway pseudopilin PulG
VRAVTAFTLIEVLMSIFVLALGLLGLGAIIPGIIREQRVASDRTLGIVVANDARAYLQARADLGRLGIAPSGGGGTGLGSTAGRSYGLGVWLRNDEWSRSYLWDTNAIDANDYQDLGNVVIGGRVGGTDPAVIPLSDRLYPSPASGLTAPQFVWDFVARRLPPTESGGYALLADSSLGLLPGTPEQWRSGVEIAVFVRRVDTGIRVPQGETGFGVMLGSTSTQILPVGVSEVGIPTGAGANTGDGQIYPPPMTLRAEYDNAKPTLLRLEEDRTLTGSEPGSTVTVENRLLLASQIGQQLVDNLGNVYTVEEVTNSGGSFVEVRVRPSVSAWIPSTSGGTPDWFDPEAWTEIRQVAFVAQPPATAIVFRMGVEPNAVKSPSGSGAGRQPL